MQSVGLVIIIIIIIIIIIFYIPIKMSTKLPSSPGA
jgi:hypothetical protein